MSTSQFGFLQAEFSEMRTAADRAASLALVDPRSSCFYSCWTVEQCVIWAFEHDRELRLPYDTNLSALVNSPSFRDSAGDKVSKITREVIRLGEKAKDDGPGPSRYDSVASVSGLFEFCYWFARTYSRTSKPPAGLTFDPKSLPDPRVPKKTSKGEIGELREQLEQADLGAKLARERLLGQDKINDEVARLRKEVAEAKLEAGLSADDHDYSEAETREFLIDLILAEAGWVVTDANREIEVKGMPNDSGIGFVDYVLWGDDDKPLALIEAKRTRRDSTVGQQQAVLYADCLEDRYGQRPIIFYTNGYDHWIWDDLRHPPRSVQGFYKKDELDLLIQRRATRTSLLDAPISTTIAGRYYQQRAIRQIAEAFEINNDRKSLLVLATGAGKTRTAVALSHLLRENNWVKRVLFLADRKALVRQAVRAFSENLPDSAPVNLVTDKNTEGRVYVSTYQTMMAQIDEFRGDERRFGVGHFDLVVIDEAHRSVFKKYRAIFDYFDSLLVGLTATPRDDIDRNTYSLFDLETGVPTDVYELKEAVEDGYLVAPEAFSTPLKFPTTGIVYDELSDDEKTLWDEIDWTGEDGVDGPVPERVDSGALNSWLFNEDTVDRSLNLLMSQGQKVEGGDRLGKSIIFAKNEKHAQFIADRFNVNYKHYKGSFARVISHSVEYSQDLIDKFSLVDSEPHIAISVDMLDTGIDIPEVVNLVFFKPVRSKTKFWQMLGRGTRLCPDLFGPGIDKEHFTIFDHCSNLEYFSQEMLSADGSSPPSIRERLFGLRVELIVELDRDDTSPALRAGLAEILRGQVETMDVDSFAIRPHRRVVEQFRHSDAWSRLDPEDQTVLVGNIAGLPRASAADSEESKRFDLLMLNLEIALLRSEPGFERLRQKVLNIVEQLQLMPSNSLILAAMEFINEIAAEQWWQDVTVEMLDGARRRLRGLVEFLDATSQEPLYTDFTDRLAPPEQIDIGDLTVSASFARFHRKAKSYLGDNMHHGAVQKIYTNQPLFDSDFDELRSVFIAAGIGSPADLDTAVERAGSFGLFVRSIIGLDRATANNAFTKFLSRDSYTADQIRFVNLVIGHLAANGIVTPDRVYESPFIDVSASGPEDLFAEDDLDELFRLIDSFQSNLDPVEDV